MKDGMSIGSTPSPDQTIADNVHARKAANTSQSNRQVENDNVLKLAYSPNYTSSMASSALGSTGNAPRAEASGFSHIRQIKSMKGEEGPSVINTVLRAMLSGWGSGCVADGILHQQLTQIGNAAMQSGNHYGSGDKFYFITPQYESMQMPDHGPENAPKPTSVSTLQPIRLPSVVPDRFEVDLSHNFHSDSAHFEGREPDTYMQNLAKLKKHVEHHPDSHGQPMQIVAHINPYGVQAVDGNGNLTPTRDEVASYNAIGGREHTEKARFVKMDVSVGTDHVDLTISSGCDQTRSRLHDLHLDHTGQTLLNKVKSEIQGVHITDNDLLGGMRAAEMLFRLRDTIGSPANQNIVVPVPGQDGQPKMVKLNDPTATIPLGTLGSDGKWKPLTDGQGKPVMVKLGDLEKLIQHNTQHGSVSHSAHTRALPPVDGGLPMDKVTTALSGGTTKLTTTQSNGSGQPTTTEHNLAGSFPTDGQADPTVTQIVASANTSEGASSVQSSADTTTTDLVSIQNSLSEITVPDGMQDQMKACKDALAAYMSLKNANAARKFEQTMAEKVLGPLRDNPSAAATQMKAFATALITRVQVNARLNEAVAQIPSNLPTAANLTAPKSQQPESNTSVMSANPASNQGAQVIVKGLLDTFASAPTSQAAPAKKALTENLTSTQGKVATATIASHVAELLDSGMKPDDIAHQLSQSLGHDVRVEVKDTDGGRAFTVHLTQPQGQTEIPLLTGTAKKDPHHVDSSTLYTGPDPTPHGHGSGNTIA